MIVVVGGSGWLGRKFRAWIKSHEIPCRAIGRRDANLYDTSELTALLAELAPSLVINCAGYTGVPNVDACEIYKTECLTGNAVLPGIVARASESLSVPWAHVSSGCIYTGTGPQGNGFSEDDSPNFTFRHNNCSFYSGCKALAEETLRDFPCGYIWRLRIPFDSVDSPKNYVSKMLRYERLLDARNSLTCVDEFVEACLQCWIRSLPFGIYNLTNGGSITTREVVAMMREHGLTKKAFEFYRDEDEFMRQAAIAPRSNCVLNNEKALRAGLKLSPVREALRRCINQWKWSAATTPVAA